MSPFQVPAIYHEHQYLEPPSNASSSGPPIASCNAVLVDHGFTQAHDYGQYPSLHGVEGYSMHSHPGYKGDHLIQEQVYGPPRSEYYSHYQPDEPPIPAHGYTIRQGSGTADDVTGVSAPQVALACSGPEPLQKFASGEPGSHRWHYVNQDQHVGNINNVWFSAPTSLSALERSGPQEPVDCATPWARGDVLQLNAMDAGSQLLPALTTLQGSRGSGLLQPDLLGSRPVGQGVQRGPVCLTSHTTRSITHPPHNLSHPNMQRSPQGHSAETNPHRCGWRAIDGFICGESITRGTVPRHLVQHGITDLRSGVPVECRWCPNGRRRINRKSIVRHVGEVHLRTRRATTSRASASRLRGSPGFSHR